MCNVALRGAAQSSPHQGCSVPVVGMEQGRGGPRGFARCLLPARLHRPPPQPLRCRDSRRWDVDSGAVPTGGGWALPAPPGHVGPPGLRAAEASLPLLPLWGNYLSATPLRAASHSSRPPPLSLQRLSKPHPCLPPGCSPQHGDLLPQAGGGSHASFLTKSRGPIYLSVPHCVTNPNCTMNPTSTRSLPVPGGAERGCEALRSCRPPLPQLSPMI